MHPGGEWKGEYLVAWIEHFRTITRKGAKRKTIPFYRTREIVYDHTKTPFFPLSEQYEKKKWELPKRDLSSVPQEEPAPEPPDQESMIAEDGSGLGPADIARGAGPPVEPQEVEVVEDHPPDEYPEHDHDFVQHAGVWFKGKYEIGADGKWIARPLHVRGRVPGISVDDWNLHCDRAMKDALWESHLEQYGPPPPVPGGTYVWPAGRGDAPAVASVGTVSYTHLTLPTKG